MFIFKEKKFSQNAGRALKFCNEAYCNSKNSLNILQQFLGGFSFICEIKLVSNKVVGGETVILSDHILSWDGVFQIMIY